MGQVTSAASARDIMLAFAEQTGLSTSTKPPRRYLWTDAHAVCNFLSLYRHTDDVVFRDLALMLVDQVHNILGRHRDDDSRSGWISGLSDAEGLAHPTAGGLRIGKRLNERRPDEPFNERLEWDRDGQYFHYLTKWMHALCRVGEVTGDPRYYRFATELARAAHAGFTQAPGGIPRLVWKMSIDLAYPLVPSAGLHDALDAYITYNEIVHCGEGFAADPGALVLDAEIRDVATVIECQRWNTGDPLGIGGLLFDACRVIQLRAAAHLGDQQLAAALVQASTESLVEFASDGGLDNPAEYRLAFRELGLSIGLHAAAKMREVIADKPDLFALGLRQEVDQLQHFSSLRNAIEAFWCSPTNQRVNSWLEHLDINRVMLATSFVPDEFLEI